MKIVQYENWDILLLFYIQMIIFLDLYTDSEHLELYLLAWTMYHLKYEVLPHKSEAYQKNVWHVAIFYNTGWVK